jgi:hypothetical protein
MDLEARWRTREGEWHRKLGRLRLGVEPLEEQLARHRRVTWALTVVTGVIALMFFSLFSAFSRPDIGAIVAVLLFGPIVLFSWLGFKKLERRAFTYRAEIAQFEAEKSRLLGAEVETPTTSGPA